MIDPAPLWDFEDAAGSEQRFRDAASSAAGDDEKVLLTQVARALGLQERYAEGHALLDTLTSMAPEVRTRIALERGRLLRSSGLDGARAGFEEAAEIAAGAGLDALRVDALQMVARVAEPTDQLAINEEDWRSPARPAIAGPGLGRFAAEQHRDGARRHGRPPGGPRVVRGGPRRL